MDNIIEQLLLFHDAIKAEFYFTQKRIINTLFCSTE